MNRCAFEEQETTINMYPKKIDEMADVYTSDPVMRNKLMKLREAEPESVEIEKEDEVGLFVRVPRKWIKISIPRKVSMSEEQRAASAERLRRAREEKKNDAF